MGARAAGFEDGVRIDGYDRADCGRGKIRRCRRHRANRATDLVDVAAVRAGADSWNSFYFPRDLPSCGVKPSLPRRNVQSAGTIILMSKRIILAGGSGFLGQALVKEFLRQNYEVIILTRSPRTRNDAAIEIAWDAKSLGVWMIFLEGAEVVINLTGKSVDCRYNEANRKAIIESRVDSTRVLGEMIAKCEQPPRVWLNSSSATLYKHTFDTPMDESGAAGATPEAKDEFSIEVIRQWERALDEAQTPD